MLAKIFLAWLIWVLSSGFATGQGVPIVAVEDSQTLRLSDGSLVRLGGLADPQLDPFQDHAAMKNYLTAHMLGGLVGPFNDANIRDRYGRILFDVEGPSGEPLNAVFIRRGLARVGSKADGADLPLLLKLEAEARQNGRGRWQSDGRGFRIFAAEPFTGRVHAFALVSGQVRAVAERRRLIYLNFGEDWRRDFTVAIERRHLRKFRQSNRDPLLMQGRQILVRGWIEWRNGPFLMMDQPALLQLLD